MRITKIAFQACSLNLNSAVQETAAQWDLQQPAVRSTMWVRDFSRLESTTWRWWSRFSPVGTHCRAGCAKSTVSSEPHNAFCSYEAAGCQAPGIYVRSKRHVHRGRRNGAFISQGPWRRPNLVAACHLREGSARVRFAGGFRARKPWLPRCSYPCRGESHRSPETSFVKPGCEPRLLNVDPRGP
jgi:hypothetical protein